MTSIFQIDWIFIDIIIIILLLLLLFGVKIFKITHRWRYSFSNTALVHECFYQTHKKNKNQTFYLSKWCLTRNSKTKSNLPLILILQTNYKRKLLRLCTEGLGSYGFTIINLKIKLKYTDKRLNHSFIDEWNSLISTILNDFKIKETSKLNYILITTSKMVYSYKYFLLDPALKDLILINPQLNKRSSSDYDELLKDNSIKPQIFIIFSGKSYLIFKNKEIDKFSRKLLSQKSYFLKSLIIDKANYSFKYYETILLGTIIDLIENKLLKSEV